MKLILDGRHEHSEHTEAIMRIWRAKPTSSSDAKRYYDFNEGYYIEDKLDEVNILKIKLPLLSKKSVLTITKEEVVIEDGGIGSSLGSMGILPATANVLHTANTMSAKQRNPSLSNNLLNLQQHHSLQAPFM